MRTAQQILHDISPVEELYQTVIVRFLEEAHKDYADDVKKLQERVAALEYLVLVTKPLMDSYARR